MKTKGSQFWAIGALLIALLSLTFFTGCNSNKDSDGDGVPDQKDKCKEVKGPKPGGCPLPAKIGQVNLYLETSASMGGYFAGSAEFKQIVSDLAVKIDKEISPVKIHFITDSIRDYPYEATRFSSDIATTKIALSNSSELHHIFNDIAKATKDGDISIFVSDCILSFPNAAVKANAEINRQAASGTLKNNIYATFIDLKGRKQAASLYAFSSAFFGKYYDYQNVKVPLKGTVRPFYVWVIAKNNILPVFDAKLAKIPNFKPEQEIHFGLLDQKINNYHILTQLVMKGDYKLIKAGKVSDAGIENVEVEKNQSIEFSAMVDLSSLPPYAKKLSYLREHLIVEASGCSANVDLSERLPSVTLKSKNQIAYYERATHVIKVNITQLRLDQATLNLRVPLTYDSWYQAWSTMNDKGVKKLGKKTFAFEHLVNGVMEAYHNEGKNLVDLKFQINQ
jgi:hypothetical protein